MDKYERAGNFARRIESEMKELGVWQKEPLPKSAYQGKEAFFADTMTFFQWIQFVLLQRVRDIVGTRGSFPASSMVGTYAIREIGAYEDCQDLVSTLCEFDQFIEGHEPMGQEAPVVEEESAAPPPPTPDPPAVVLRRWWDTRDASLLHPQPAAAAGYDTSLAEGVWKTATRLIEVIDDSRVVVEAERGLWVVVTVLREHEGYWRVDRNASVERTAYSFLRMHQVHPPYTDNDDARGRAMRFWHYVQNHDERRAAELMLGGVEFPKYGSGQIDEFFWYLDESVDGVRVLMNTHEECKMLLTKMVNRDSKWFVKEISALP